MERNGKSVFNNPQLVAEQLNLPAVISYSFIGSSTPAYHAVIEAIVVRIAGEENIRRREHKPSSGGTYTAYRFDVHHTEFADVESLYREVGALEGTKFVL